MSENDKFNKQVKEFTDKLLIVKEGFIELQKEKLVSIRKDVVMVELKDILNKSNDYETLKTNIQEYIKNLSIINKDGETIEDTNNNDKG